MIAAGVLSIKAVCPAGSPRSSLNHGGKSEAAPAHLISTATTTATKYIPLLSVDDINPALPMVRNIP